MTTQKPELMPDEAWLIRSPYYEWRDDKTQADYVSEVNCNSAGASVSYTRTDLYTAACAERDALRALCEGMAAFIEQERNAIFYAMTRGQNYDIGLAKERMTAALTAYEKHKAGE